MAHYEAFLVGFGLPSMKILQKKDRFRQFRDRLLDDNQIFGLKNKSYE